MGAQQSGEDLVSGENNFSNGETMLIASTGTKFGNMFVVAPDGDLSKGPNVGDPVNAIVGFGYQGGAGVVGRGDAPATEYEDGVIGRGTGGHGVVGEGGSGDAETNAMEFYHEGRPGTFKPGAGVVGFGGYWIGPAFDGNGKALRGPFGGPGVVGYAGGVNVREPDIIGGPAEGLPPANWTEVEGVGVYGRSAYRFGVQGNGKECGIRGHGINGPGGIFSSGSDLHIRAQIELVPVVMQTLPEEPLAVWGINPAKAGKYKLPSLAKTGQLLLTKVSDNDTKGPGIKDSKGASATLWLCTRAGRDAGRDFTDWRQVLLGPVITAE